RAHGRERLVHGSLGVRGDLLGDVLQAGGHDLAGLDQRLDVALAESDELLSGLHDGFFLASGFAKQHHASSPKCCAATSPLWWPRRLVSTHICAAHNALGASLRPGINHLARTAAYNLLRVLQRCWTKFAGPPYRAGTHEKGLAGCPLQNHGKLSSPACCSACASSFRSGWAAPLSPRSGPTGILPWSWTRNRAPSYRPSTRM